MNTALLKCQLILKEKSLTSLSNYLCISRSALYRKLNGKSEFTRKEISKIKDYLNLSNETVITIFFKKKVS